MTKTASSVLAVVLVGSLGFLAWDHAGGWLSQPVLGAPPESRKASARVLEEVGVVPDELRESSGLAVSRTQPGVIWSHNDSGDGPTLYAIDLTGKLLAKVPVFNAIARDWEDISSGPCPAGIAPSDSPRQTACLFIADTGDNNQVRPEVTIYVVVEPRLGATGTPPPTTFARAFRYRYPMGPNDAEALAVRPSGDITIVSKGRSGTIDFFSIPVATVAKAIASGEIVTARYDGNTGIRPDQRNGRLVTAAAVSPDGNTLAVRTYYDVYFFGLVNDRRGTRWRDLKRPPCSLGDAEPQGEAIDYLDENTLLLTSEQSRGRPGSIHKLQC